jgi:hypothetical protein
MAGQHVLEVADLLTGAARTRPAAPQLPPAGARPTAPAAPTGATSLPADPFTEPHPAVTPAPAPEPHPVAPASPPGTALLPAGPFAEPLPAVAAAPAAESPGGWAKDWGVTGPSPLEDESREGQR